MKVIGIIQARMGSTRLPGKMMRKIVDKPVLWHTANRLKHSKFLDKLVIATTDKKIDEPITLLAKDLNLKTFTGSEKDVLDRFYQTAKYYQAQIIARFCGDCPLIDPEIIDRVIGHYLKYNGKIDYVRGSLNYPSGIAAVGIFSFLLLEKAWYEAKSSIEREHVILYIWKNEKQYKIVSVGNKQDWSHIHLTVDTEKDFQRIKSIFSFLYKENKIFHLQEILDFLEKNPQFINEEEENIHDYHKRLKNLVKES